MYEIFDSFDDNVKMKQWFDKLNNYKVEKIQEGKYCWIFFTSHGLYFPTEMKEFEKQVILNDRYEWVNISRCKGIKTRASKYIFVRDIYKNWCLEGINTKCNSIEKLADLLKKEANGNEIITVGSSAGGYMAIALGCLLKATYIYAFSPQISLDEYNKFHNIKYLSQYHTDEREKWLSLEPIIKNYNAGEIFYYYPTQCEEDVAQYEVIKNITNERVHIFGVKFTQHGTPIYSESVIKTLCLEPNKVITLCKKYNGKEISRMRYLADTSGWIIAVITEIGRWCKKIIKSQHK